MAFTSGTRFVFYLEREISSSNQSCEIQAEFDQVLGDEDAPVAAYFWAVKPRGNVDPSSDIQGELKGKVSIGSTHGK